MLAAHLLSLPFPSKSLFSPTLVSGLHIVRVLFHLFDDVFLLDTPFETTERTLDRFTVLYSDLGHSIAPPFN